MRTAKPYVDEAIKYIPKIIFLCDRNNLSDTYGSFDRPFWHYRTADFPSGMYQEYSLPLALVYAYKMSQQNVWYRNQRVKELALAGVNYANKAMHSDGSLDDYFPYERALGASAFSLQANLETCILLEYFEPETLRLLKKRCDFLFNYKETGTLSNHNALVLLNLGLAAQLFKSSEYGEKYEKKKIDLLSQQTEEGWFPEYEGCDPGYLTATVSFLAQTYNINKDEDLVRPIKKAVDFCSYFLHADNSYGGEYGSRNTYHFFPLGFALFASISSNASFLYKKYSDGIINTKHYINDDDRVFGHVVSEYLKCGMLKSVTHKIVADKRLKRKTFPIAGLATFHGKDYSVVVSLKKGGVIKAHNNKGCFLSDTGPIILDSMNKLASTNFFFHKNKGYVSNNIIETNATFLKPFSSKLVGSKFLIFRFLNYSVGRIFPNFIRFIIQSLSITNKTPYKATFERKIKLEKSTIEILETISISSKIKVKNLLFLTDHNPIYTATSKSYQESVLLPTYTLPEKSLTKLNSDRTVSITRRFRTLKQGYPL